MSDITICAADCVNMSLAARALHRSMANCKFADAVLFSHVPVAGAFRNVAIPRLRSSSDYSAFILGRLPSLIQTSFVLVVQWDGFVVSPAAWRPEFRDYDYIGAKWDWHDDGLTVGNGGFSLRSRKLLDALADPQFAMIPNRNEDELICRVFRPALERLYGIRFAPEGVADQFSYERSSPPTPTFGFHGLTNMWRHLDGPELIETATRIHPYLCRSRELPELLAHCLWIREFAAAYAIYARLCTELGPAGAARAIFDNLRDDEVARHCLKLCGDLAEREALRGATRNPSAFGDRQLAITVTATRVTVHEIDVG